MRLLHLTRDQNRRKMEMERYTFAKAIKLPLLQLVCVSPRTVGLFLSHCIQKSDSHIL